MPAQTRSRTSANKAPEVAVALVTKGEESENSDVPQKLPKPKTAGQKATTSSNIKTEQKQADATLTELPHGMSVEGGAETFITLEDAAAIAVAWEQNSTENASETLDTNSKVRSYPAPKFRDLNRNPFPESQLMDGKEAQDVFDILSGVHGQIGQPVDSPDPAPDVAGCGEVKFLLEGLVRTIISQNVSFAMANKVVSALIQRYRRFQDGPTAGCVDWDRVRREGPKALEEVLKPAGNQKNKALWITSLLNQVNAINSKLRAALGSGEDSALAYEKFMSMGMDPAFKAVLPKRGKTESAESSDTDDTNTSGIDRYAAVNNYLGKAMSDNAKQVLCSGHRLLTMDFVHEWPTDVAFVYLQTFLGIGVKTSACALLFCLQRPLLAVDVNVERLAKKLGWVPKSQSGNLSVDDVFFFCNLWVPNELKYALHQLFIIHGKLCPRCGPKPNLEAPECCLQDHFQTDPGLEPELVAAEKTKAEPQLPAAKKRKSEAGLPDAKKRKVQTKISWAASPTALNEPVDKRDGKSDAVFVFGEQAGKAMMAAYKVVKANPAVAVVRNK